MSDPDGIGRRLPSLGARGGGWVAIQFALFAGVALACVAGPRWPPAWRTWLVPAGVALTVAGAGLAAWGARALGGALTALPKPRLRGALSVGSAYRFARHPIYGGAIVVALGLSVATGPWALVSAAVLEVFFELKSRREEAWLVERHPAYPEYRRAVPWRFVRFVR